MERRGGTSVQWIESEMSLGAISCDRLVFLVFEGELGGEHSAGARR